MFEDEVQEFVNKVIQRENGKAIAIDDLLADSDLDSLGYIILYAELDDKFMGITTLQHLHIDYKTYTLRQLIKDVQQVTPLVSASDSYDITKIVKKDLFPIYHILKSEISDKLLLAKLKWHIRHGVSYKISIDGKIKALFLAASFETHMFLSYYHIDEDLRKKSTSLFFFMHFMHIAAGRPVLIYANKNLKDYGRYFEQVDSDKLLYQYKDLRSQDEWRGIVKITQLNAGA